MIFSLLKAALFLSAIAALSYGLDMSTAPSGQFSFMIGGWEFTPEPLLLAVVLIALLVAMWVLMLVIDMLLAFVKFLSGDETALSRYWGKSREKKGKKALSDALFALATGDGKAALTQARRAEKYLDQPALTTLVLAQSATAIGNKDLASAAYKRLLKTPGTQIAGFKGLLTQCLAEGNKKVALVLAQKALELAPKDTELQDTLLELQTSQENWQGAHDTLKAKYRMGTLPRDVFRRREAILILSQAQKTLADAPEDKAIIAAAKQKIIEANRLSPSLIAGAVSAANILTAKGNKRAASKIIRKAWASTPHPDLAAAFAAIEPDETPQARLKRFQALYELRVHDEETKLLNAELSLVAEDFPAARRILSPLVNQDETTQRALILMAAVERSEGGDEDIVRGWLAKATTAPQGPQWCCEKCQSIWPQWSPVCAHCGAFDTLSWKTSATAPTPSKTLASTSALLPLLMNPDTQKSLFTQPMTVTEIEQNKEPSD